MKKVIIGLVVALTSLSALAGEGVVTVASTHSAKDTADKFVAIAQEKGLNVFARINHQENATNKKVNSIGSVIPVNQDVNAADIIKPPTIFLRSGDAQW